MARYLEADTQRKFAIANKSLEACDEFLSHNEVIGAIGDLAHYARNLLEYIYIPDAVNGVYQTTGHPAEGIPFVIADPGEKLTIARDRKSIVHPWQWDQIRHKIAAIDSDEMTDKSFRQIKKWILDLGYEMNGERHRITMDNNAYAFVFAESSGIGITKKRHQLPTVYGVETRPMIFGNSELLQREEARSNIFHELVHVLQFFRGDEAIFEPGDKRRWKMRGFELEAYAYQATAEETYYGVPIHQNTYGWTSMAVEGIRRSLNTRHKQPFKATPDIMHHLSQNGIIIEH